jgi:HEAT repeat protein
MELYESLNSNLKGECNLKQDEDCDVILMNILKDVDLKMKPEIRAMHFKIIQSFPVLSVKLLPILEEYILKETNEVSMTYLMDCYLEHAKKAFGINVFLFLDKLVNEKSLLANMAVYGLSQMLEYVHINGLADKVNGLAGAIVKVHKTLLDYVKKCNLLDPKKDQKIEQILSSNLSLLLINDLFGLEISHEQILEICFNERFYTKCTRQGELLLSKTFILYAKNFFDGFKFDHLVYFIYTKTFYKTQRFTSAKITRLCSLDHRKMKYFVGQACAGFGVKLDEKNLIGMKLDENIWGDKTIRSSNVIGQQFLNAICACLPHIDYQLKDVGLMADEGCENVKSTEEMVHHHSHELVLKNVLMDLLVICNHETITNTLGDDVWIALCYRVGIPPFANEETLDTLLCFDQSENLGGLSKDNSFANATKKALLLSSRVSSKLVLDKIYKWTIEQLQNGYETTLDDYNLYKSEKGVVYKKDVKEQVEKGLNKDEKWERDLKLELKQKKNILTKQEQLEIDKQLEKEHVIREQVEEKIYKVSAVLDCLGIAVGCDSGEWKTVSGVYLMDVIDLLLAIVKKEYVEETFGKIAGAQVFELLIEIGKRCLSSELDSELFTYSTFMAIGVMDGIPPKYQFNKDAVLGVYEEIEESLDAFGFMFLFPLLQTIVWKKGAVKNMSEKSYTELVMATADLLLKHANLEGVDSMYIPRDEMVKSMVLLMETYPRLHSSVRQGMFGLSVAYSKFEIDEGHTEKAIKASQDIVKEFLVGLSDNEGAVRASCLGALGQLDIPECLRDEFDVLVWILTFDEDDLVQAEADALWNETHAGSIKDTLISNILALVVHPAIGTSAGKALCGVLIDNQGIVDQSLNGLYQMYDEYNAECVPEFDEYGMVIPESLNQVDQWQSRSGIAGAIGSMVEVIKTKQSVLGVFEFLIEHQSLGDRNPDVRQRMLSSGLLLLEKSATPFIAELLDMFDSKLSQPDSNDKIRESVVILMGTLARYLDPMDKRVSETVMKLMETLKTPSEVVQIAVSECLPGLIKINKKHVSDHVKQLLDMLFTSEKYGHRRGAAYGLAGIVKGTGISSLKDYLIMANLKEAVEDKRNLKRREGALLAFETLSYTLGRMFEPYVIQILPHLLVCYGDSNREIREATEDACRVIMSKLSAHCVKLLLPSLLNGLQERSFRSKIGAIEVMASMSALAPKQLGQSLPTIVPKICEALGDSHQKVQEAAREALKQFGKVIKNPEIQFLVPVLISALTNPNAKTLPALSELLDTTFVHYIDAPSLALLVPIIHRGMKERSAETKKKAAQIMGNMSSLTEPSDLIPYLDLLLPELKEVLVDPVPDARTTAAKAFGTMIEKMGEEKFPGLVEELLDILRADNSSVDRSGAAQGLSEVLYGIGIERLKGLLPEIINNANSIEPTTREGFTILLVYLPHTFGESFTPFIAEIVPTMLEGLADEIETVREAALHVGQVIVRNYAKSAIQLVLPELEKGLFNDNWRIRQNSVQLIGDLIFRIAGISQTLQVDENDEAEGFGTENHRVALRIALGDRYDTVLASLYIVRADSSGLVRQCAIGIWKALVTNTPKTLKQILPCLMNLLLGSLASSSYEKRTVSARTLGDLVRRLGDSVMTMILPILENGLNSEDDDTREGVCIGLAEMMNSAGKLLDSEFLLQCTPLVRKALVDSSADVRNSAAQVFYINKAFDVLNQQLGSKAVDEIIPAMLNSLGDDTDGFALEGLKEIMAVRGNSVFPVLIPTLLSKPITTMNAHALSALISVAGDALNKRLGLIIPALMSELETDSEVKEDILASLEAIMTNVEGDGVYKVVDLLTENLEEGSLFLKITACKCLGLFFSGTSEPLNDFIPDMLTLLITNLRHDSPELVLECWNALDILVKGMRKDEMERFVRQVKKGLYFAMSGLAVGEYIEGFNLPKGAGPVVTILLQGLVTGGNDTREISAYCLGDVISRSDDLSLKPFVTQITGPLIRVIGDRFPPSVKTAILTTLSVLLEKVPSMLKPFLPQLQRTFVKCLSEQGSSAAMREKTAECLSQLIPLQTRLDPLVVELVQGVRTADEGVQKTMWEALFGLLKGVHRDSGKTLNETSRTNIKGLIDEMLWESGEYDLYKRVGAAKCFGAYCKTLTIEESQELVKTVCSKDLDQEWYRAQSMLLSLSNLYDYSPETLTDTEVLNLVTEKVVVCLNMQKAIYFLI